MIIRLGGIILHSRDLSMAGRYFGSHTKFICLLLLILLTVVIVNLRRPSQEILPHTSIPRPEGSGGQLLALQAEVGHLRALLAGCGVAVGPRATEQFVPIHVITPTFARPVQKAELTRLAAVLLLVPGLHWILVEDAASKTELVTNFLAYSGINYTHINVQTPSEMKLKSTDPHWSKPRGVQQRNEALAWLRRNALPGQPGVVYFADDDNSYSPDLFPALAATSTVSVFPVGLVGGVMVERPRVAAGKVTGWSVGWGTDRAFATDMAGFAINLSFLLQHPAAKFAAKVKRGNQESEFLSQLVRLDQLEPISNDRVMVWHTRTEDPNLNMEKKFEKVNGHASDLGLEV